MVLIIGKFNVDPAQRAGFLVFARHLVERERTQRGCLGFDIYEDITTPDTFLMVEQWQDEAALDAHAVSSEFEEGERVLDGFILGEPSWDEYHF